MDNSKEKEAGHAAAENTTLSNVMPTGSAPGTHPSSSSSTSSSMKNTSSSSSSGFDSFASSGIHPATAVTTTPEHALLLAQAQAEARKEDYHDHHHHHTQDGGDTPLVCLPATLLSGGAVEGAGDGIKSASMNISNCTTISSGDGVGGASAFLDGAPISNENKEEEEKKNEDNNNEEEEEEEEEMKDERPGSPFPHRVNRGHGAPFPPLPPDDVFLNSSVVTSTSAIAQQKQQQQMSMRMPLPVGRKRSASSTHVDPSQPLAGMSAGVTLGDEQLDAELAAALATAQQNNTRNTKAKKRRRKKKKNRTNAGNNEGDGDEVDVNADEDKDEVEDGGAKDVEVSTPLPVTLLGVDNDLRRKRIKKVSNYILGPLLGEGVYGVVRDAISMSPEHQKFRRCAVKMVALSNSSSSSGSGGGHNANTHSNSGSNCNNNNNSVSNQTNGSFIGSPTSANHNMNFPSKGFRKFTIESKMRYIFQNEVNNLQRFHNQHLIRAYDLFSRHGREYVVLPIAICSLEQFVQQTLHLERRKHHREKQQQRVRHASSQQRTTELHGKKQQSGAKQDGGLTSLNDVFFKDSDDDDDTTLGLDMRDLDDNDNLFSYDSDSSSGSSSSSTHSNNSTNSTAATTTDVSDGTHRINCQGFLGDGGSESSSFRVEVAGSPPLRATGAGGGDHPLLLVPGGSVMTGRPQGVKVRRAILPPILVKGIMHQILAGVAYLHEQSIAHNDIKPSNILLFEDGTVKLTDLGSIGEVFNDQGTPLFASPEICKYFYGMSGGLTGEGKADNNNNNNNTSGGSSTALNESLSTTNNNNNNNNNTTITSIGSSSSESHVDARASDMWCCGLVLYYLITGKPGPLEVQKRYFKQLHHKHCGGGGHHHHRHGDGGEREMAAYPMNRFQLYREIAACTAPVNLDDVPDMIIEIPASAQTAGKSSCEGGGGPPPASSDRTTTMTTTTTAKNSQQAHATYQKISSSFSTQQERAPGSAYPHNSVRDLLARLLEIDPAKRITATEALMHPWVTMAFKPSKTQGGGGSNKNNNNNNNNNAHSSHGKQHSSGANASISKKVPSKKAMEDAVQRDVARRVLQTRQVKSMIKRDRQRHLQFVADCCNILNITVPPEIIRAPGSEPFGEEQPSHMFVHHQQRGAVEVIRTSHDNTSSSILGLDDGSVTGVVVSPSLPTRMPSGCVDPDLFLPHEEEDYYERKSGRTEFDVRVLRDQPMKLRQLEEYLRNVVMVHCGYRTGEDPRYAVRTTTPGRTSSDGSVLSAGPQRLTRAASNSSGGAVSMSVSLSPTVALGTVIRPGASGAQAAGAVVVIADSSENNNNNNSSVTRGGSVRSNNNSLENNASGSATEARAHGGGPVMGVAVSNDPTPVHGSGTTTTTTMASAAAAAAGASSTPQHQSGSNGNGNSNSQRGSPTTSRRRVDSRGNMMGIWSTRQSSTGRLSASGSISAEADVHAIKESSKCLCGLM